MKISKFGNFLRKRWSLGNGTSQPYVDRCLLNSLFVDSNLSNRFKKKHLEDLEVIRVPPAEIELNTPDPELIVDLFNRLALESPKDETLRDPFDTAVIAGRAALLRLASPVRGIAAPPPSAVPATPFAPQGASVAEGDPPPMQALGVSLLTLGDLRSADDDPAAAARAYLLAMKCAPADHRPSLRLGKLMRRTPGDRLLALYHLMRAAELSPDDPEILFEKAICRLLIRDILGGFADLDRLVRMLPRPEETFLRFVHAMTAEGLLKFALVLIHHNRDHECVSIPTDPAEIEELLGPCAAYIHHYGFRGGDYPFELAIREVARLFLEGAYDDALESLAALEDDRNPEPGETAAYRGLLLEAKRDPAGALAAYESFLKSRTVSPVAPLVRGRFDELASALLKAEVRVAPAPARKALLFIEKNRLFDAILSLDDERVLEETLDVEPGVHEMRVSFLGRSRMLTSLFQEGRSYRLALDGDERDFSCRIEEALPYRLTARSEAEPGDGDQAIAPAAATEAPLHADSIAARLSSPPPPAAAAVATSALVSPLFPEPLLPPESCREEFSPADVRPERRASGTGGLKRRRRSDRDDALLNSAQ